MPQHADGFVETDEHGRVRGLADVYAAGDITAFPVKQGGIAAQQADAVAEAIAARAGADLIPRPFRPVLRGVLLTGAEHAYLRRDLAGGTDDLPGFDVEPLWWPAGKIVGRYLAPFLAARVGAAAATTPPPGIEAVPVEVDLSP